MSVPKLSGVKSMEPFVEQLRLVRIQRSGDQRLHVRAMNHGLKRFAFRQNCRTLQEGFEEGAAIGWFRMVKSNTATWWNSGAVALMFSEFWFEI